MDEYDTRVAAVRSMSPLIRALWEALIESHLSIYKAKLMTPGAWRNFHDVAGWDQKLGKMLLHRRRKLAQYAITQTVLACVIIKIFTQGRLTADHRIHNPEAAGSIPAPAPIPLIGVNGQRQELNHAGQSLSCPAMALGGAA